MRSLHSVDIDFLQTLHKHTSDGTAPLGVVAVLSRADEVGAGRIDAMLGVKQAVKRYRDDPALKGLCDTLLPVAGLLALAGTTLRQTEFDALCVLEASPREDVDRMLLSADRFTRNDDALPVTSQIRKDLAADSDSSASGSPSRSSAAVRVMLPRFRSSSYDEAVWTSFVGCSMCSSGNGTPSSRLIQHWSPCVDC